MFQNGRHHVIMPEFVTNWDHFKTDFFKIATTVSAIIHQFFSIMMPFTRKKNKTHGLTYIFRIKIDIIIPNLNCLKYL